MSNWCAVHVGVEGDAARIGGLPVWAQFWRRTGEAAVLLPHPCYPAQRHRFDIYEAGPPERRVRFAAGELSNGVWGFYVPV